MTRTEPLTGTPSPLQSAAAGALLLRLALGVMYIAHALLKFFVFGLDGTVAFFGSIGLAGTLAYPVFAAELIGGIALLIGFYARQVAVILAPILAGAIWAHSANGWLFTNSGGGWEYPVFLLAASLVLWLIGDGAFAVKRSARFAPREA